MPSSVPMRHSSIRQHARRQTGLTIVEILVTVLIISIGLLGVAALHLVSLHNNYDANMRTQATTLAHDIADRMRANWTNALSTANPYAINLSDAAPTIISSSSLADRDLNAWKTQLAATLPSGQGSVQRGTVNGAPVFTIMIQWSEHETTMSFTTNVEI